MNTKSKYTHRFIAHIVMEAVTPLAVSNGEKSILTDALVATDVNGLPFIPGTTLAGILRHAIDDDERTAAGESVEEFSKKSDKLKKSSIFGYQIFGKDSDGIGSNIIFSEAKMVGENGNVIDGLQPKLATKFYEHFRYLPIRQHVRINEKGVTEDTGKFDEQVVFKGTRFCFEIEMVSDGSDWDKFKAVLQLLCNNIFRVGSGTRSGFGKMKIVSCKTHDFNLSDKSGLNDYLAKSSDLSKSFKGEDFKEDTINNNWITYSITLQPEDFFLFSSGFGDEQADMTPVKEDMIVWTDGTPKFTKEPAVLIPATSIKGALAHRVAFHYNKINGIFADKLAAGEAKKFTGKNNDAVTSLFGSEGNKNESTRQMENQQRGNVIFSDIIETKEVDDKILNHVSIDRFTGGAIDGALFTEKATYAKGQSFTTEILVNKAAFSSDPNIKEAFEAALCDICNGLLPLGGGVNRGNGTFKGEASCDGKIICSTLNAH
jgi:CRISPR/Cas system CSM-associated protein Csm3 (group 7 of RAMP superfamily)